MSLTFWTATYSVRVRSSSTTFVETVSEFGEDFVFFFSLTAFPQHRPRGTGPPKQQPLHVTYRASTSVNWRELTALKENT